MPTMRGHNEGSLFRRGRDGRWVATVTMPDGRRRSASAASKGEGVRALGELLRQRDQAVADPRRVRVGSYLQRWIASVTGLAPATMRQHEMIVRVHLVPALGRRLLTQLTPSDVDAYLEALELDPQTRRHHRSTLRRALADAVRDGLVSRNVAALSLPPRMTKAERTYLTADQVRLVIAGARDERWWPLWIVIVTTGLRVSEALGLAWSDVDLTEGTVTVRRQLSRQAGEWVRTQPKTRRSRRTIPLTPEALEAFAEQRRRQDADIAGHPRPIDGLVFTTPAGQPVHSTNVLPAWYATLRRLGLPRVTIHDLRHTSATLMLQAGVPLPVIAEILGHSTMRVTADLYAHVTPMLQRDAADRMHRALS